MDVCHRLAIECRRLRALAKDHERHAHRRAFVDPFLVAPGLEDACGLQHAIEDFAILPSAYGVRRDQARAVQLPGFHLRSRFLEPVADEVGETGHARRVGSAQLLGILDAEFSPLLLGSQKRRIADHHIGLRPLRLACLPRVAIALPRQQRITAFDLLQRLQHRVGLGRVAVGDAPLDFADPDGDAREFRRVAVELDAQQVVHAGDEVLLAVQPQAGRGGDAVQLDVLERLQAQEEKVAAAAGRIEHAKRPQALQPLHEARVRLLVRGVAVALDFGRQRLQFPRHLLPFA